RGSPSGSVCPGAVVGPALCRVESAAVSGPSGGAGKGEGSEGEVLNRGSGSWPPDVISPTAAASPITPGVFQAANGSNADDPPVLCWFCGGVDGGAGVHV
ncbi:MAG: hypothetical protein HOQ36_04240, partial [Nocardia sp.]|nr:hypothetical protein [Nocardia sp.]